MVEPADILSSTDAGDEMQRRLRYQAAYGALVCLDLLNDEMIAEVFCEHHEDFLIRKVDGKYIGVQVKTRATHLGPFTSNDDAVVTALTRFVQLDIDFPGYFDNFVIVANCDFWQADENEKNLPHVIARLQKNANTSFVGTMKGVISGIRSTCKCSKKAIVQAIIKTRLEGTVPKFEDITATVAVRVGNIDEFKSRYLLELYICGTTLIERILAASALPCDVPARTHFIYASNPLETAVQQVINHKRLTRDLVLDILRNSLAMAVTLRTTDASTIEHLPLGHHRLEQKMAAGEISFQSISIAKDHQASMEYVLQEWLHQYGVHMATKRFEQVDIIVRTQCAEAYDGAFSDLAAFGSAMLQDLRARLKVVAEKDKAATFGLRYEHLLGLVSLATQGCRIWWSKPFTIAEVG